MPNETLSRGRLMVIDDDAEMRALLSDFFTNEGYAVKTFPLATEAFEALRSDGNYEAIVTDLRMAQMDGMQFLKSAQSIRPEIPVILITAFGSTDTAIDAMRNGAYDYIVKPFKLAEMRVIIDRAAEKRRLSRDNELLRSEVKKGFRLGEVLGKSPAMQSVFELVKKVAQASSNVLVTGESGTGKEVVARLVHTLGPRAQKPFIAINCTAIPETLLESELFGHAKGSFTGAHQRKQGLFEEAEGGTLFLDEIGDMSPALQAKLLRVIQERKVRPVGDNTFHDINVRIIAATHKDLKTSIRQGTFREDLFYRLSVIPIAIPPLRARPEDIPLLAEHFLQKTRAASGTNVRGFTRRAMAKLMSLKWEGNVRELENVVERAVVLSPSDMIDVDDVPTPELASPDEFFQGATQDSPTLLQLEERYLKLVLEMTHGRKDKAAQILGINRRTLYRKEREYGLVPASSPDAEADSDEETTGSTDVRKSN
ncbi:MAG: sigma-54-dependent Fis family transcriptional regulator [Deltaproteobacteria bacterium]|nr:sigma-54-dependent Fis family transcriptional regulator [Deltaproteobacteria bacterium]